MLISDLKIPSGIAIPQVFTSDPLDLELIRTFVKQAEDTGYESLWVQEKIIGEADSLEPINLLSYVSAISQKIKLGTAVIIATTRNPILLAKELSTLDCLSEGRLIVGIALGGRPDTYPILGGPLEKRVRHFNEFIDILKVLWTEQDANFNGEFWEFKNLSMRPRPLQKPNPPLWFGGRHPAALKRAVLYGDGWMGAGSTSTTQFKGHVDIIKSQLNESETRYKQFSISKRIYIAVDENEDRARSRLRKWFNIHYGNADLSDKVSIWGCLEKCKQGVQQVVDAGAQMLMFNPVFDHMYHLEKISQELIPDLDQPRKL